MPSHMQWDLNVASAIIGAHLGLEGPLLPILHALQSAFGYIAKPAVPMVADALNLTRAEVHGVVTFYPEFRRAMRRRRVIKLCRAEACQACGGDALADAYKPVLASSLGGTTPDGRVTLSRSTASAYARPRLRR